MGDKAFTDEQMRILMNNPYVARVTPHVLRMTYEFKQLFWEETRKPGMTSRKIFASCGLDADLIGESRIKNIGKTIRKEASSPEGLKPVRIQSLEEKHAVFAKRDMAKATASNLKAMHRQLVELQQEVDFLKKLLSIYSAPDLQTSEGTEAASGNTS